MNRYEKLKAHNLELAQKCDKYTAQIEKIERELAEAREEVARMKEARTKAANFIDCTLKSYDALRVELASAKMQRDEALETDNETRTIVYELRAELARVNESFQQETLRNSDLTHLLAAWVEQHELEHKPGPWSKGCSTCALVSRSWELLKDTIFAGALEKELRAARQPEQREEESNG